MISTLSLRVHEYRGSVQPVRIAINDFQVWTNAHDLIHLPTHGAKFTWSNGWKGRFILKQD